LVLEFLDSSGKSINKFTTRLPRGGGQGGAAADNTGRRWRRLLGVAPARASTDIG
jgi:hypothetical protein